MQPAQTEIRTTSCPRCLLCGSVGQELYRNLSDPYFDAPGVWQLKKCPQANCGLLWLDPRLAEEDLHLAYQTYFTHADESGSPGSTAGLRSFLFRIYGAARLLPEAITGLGESKKKLSRMHLDDLPAGKLLDVGCGSGIFLNRMRGLGWTVDGIDFDPKAIEHAKQKYGLNLRCGDLRNAKLPENSFDAVTMSHVIEHLSGPVSLLAEIRRLLKPGGRLVMTTPNSESLGHKKFQACWFGIDAPRHLNIYSPRTLGECSRQAGFKVARSFSSAANADIFIGGSFSIRDAPNHCTTVQPRISPARIMKTILFQYREHSLLRAQPDCGEEAVAVCVKENT